MISIYLVCIQRAKFFHPTNNWIKSRSCGIQIEIAFNASVPNSIINI